MGRGGANRNYLMFKSERRHQVVERGRDGHQDQVRQAKLMSAVVVAASKLRLQKYKMRISK